jgi:hypothetical protein
LPGTLPPVVGKVFELQDDHVLQLLHVIYIQSHALFDPFPQQCDRLPHIQSEIESWLSSEAEEVDTCPFELETEEMIVL